MSGFCLCAVASLIEYTAFSLSTFVLTLRGRLHTDCKSFSLALSLSLPRFVAAFARRFVASVLRIFVLTIVMLSISSLYKCRLGLFATALNTCLCYRMALGACLEPPHDSAVAWNLGHAGECCDPADTMISEILKRTPSRTTKGCFLTRRCYSSLPALSALGLSAREGRASLTCFSRASRMD